MKQKRSSIGIVGAGAIVERLHLPVLMNLDDVRVAWLVDADHARARGVGRAFGVRAADIGGDAVKLPEADIVLIAAPYGARAPYYEVLRERSSAVYVEKPIALSSAEHRELCSYFPEHRFGCGLQRRSWGPMRIARDAVGQGMFGELRGIRYGWGTAGGVRGAGFRADAKMAGGGMLAEQAIHGIDAAMFCAGATAAEVLSARTVMESGLDIHAEAAVALSIADGGKVDFELLVTCLCDTIGGIEFHFDRAALFVPAGVPEVTVRPLGAGAEFALAPRNPSAYPLTPFQTLHEHWRNFIRGARDGRANYTSAASAILATGVIEGIYRAAAQPAEAGIRCSA